MPIERPKEQESKEAANKKRVFIEVGTYDFPITAIGEKEFSEDEIYIGLDINPRRTRAAKEAAEDWKGERKNVHFVSADARELPLSPKSVDEIFFGNVFGDPKIGQVSKEKLLNEATRVLKKDGTMIINESNTPADKNAVTELLDENGFFVENMAERGSQPSEWKKLTRPYAKGWEILAGNESYILFAKPKSGLTE